MSGLASLISRFILRMTPICSSLLRREYLSSRGTSLRLGALCAALYVSRLALASTTIKRLVSLADDDMGTCCSATSLGSSGGGSDCVPIAAANLLGLFNKKRDHRIS